MKNTKEIIAVYWQNFMSVNVHLQNHPKIRRNMRTNTPAYTFYIWRKLFSFYRLHIMGYSSGIGVTTVTVPAQNYIWKQSTFSTCFIVLLLVFNVIFYFCRCFLCLVKLEIMYILYVKKIRLRYCVMWWCVGSVSRPKLFEIMTKINLGRMVKTLTNNLQCLVD